MHPRVWELALLSGCRWTNTCYFKVSGYGYRPNSCYVQDGCLLGCRRRLVWSCVAHAVSSCSEGSYVECRPGWLICCSNEYRCLFLRFTDSVFFIMHGLRLYHVVSSGPFWPLIFIPYPFHFYIRCVVFLGIPVPSVCLFLHSRGTLYMLFVESGDLVSWFGLCEHAVDPCLYSHFPCCEVLLMFVWFCHGSFCDFVSSGAGFMMFPAYFGLMRGILH
jgi:hypothetical protein